MKDILIAHKDPLRILLDPQHKGYVRFLPTAWNVPQNSGGTAWGTNSRIVLCEISFWTKNAELHITVGRAPNAWADKVWERAEVCPFKQEFKKRPAHFVKPFKAKSDIAVDMFADADPEQAKDELTNWIATELRSERFRTAVDVMSGLLAELPKSSSDRGS